MYHLSLAFHPRAIVCSNNARSNDLLGLPLPRHTWSSSTHSRRLPRVCRNPNVSRSSITDTSPSRIVASGTKKPNKPSARRPAPPDYAGRCCRPISTGPDNKAIKQPRCSPSLDVYLTSTHSYKPVGAGHSNKDSRRAHFSDTRRGPAGGDCRPFVSRVPAAASAYFFFIDMISCSTVFFLLDFPSLLSLHLVVAPPSFPRSCRLHLWPALACLELAGQMLS